MFLIIRLILESFSFAIHALSVNKLRTFLSLLGISIGIFAIIAVYTIVDSLEANIRNSVQSLGGDVIYVQKWSWGGGGEYPWWKYLQRPEPSYGDYRELDDRLGSAESIVFGMTMSGTAKHANNSVEQVGVLGATHDYNKIWDFDLVEGRYFSEIESNSGPNIAIIGSDIAEGLFPSSPAEGKKFSVLGKKFTVIGVFERVGQGLVGGNIDELILIPASAMRKMVNPDRLNGNMIMCKAKPSVGMDIFKDELRVAMRSIRRLKPKTDDDFSLNEISLISNQLDQLFKILGMVGTVIGGFSILVGGFGIANIMFVSVSERKNQIGIQKSLGAKNYFILLQFLFESVVLSLFGGIIGLIFVVVGVLLASESLDFEFIITTGNVVTGIVISVIIGLISGTIPAVMASKLDPVEAIRSGI
jgi:putative ABC transport system permease protein